MQRRHHLLLIGILFATTADAQKPDFTGTWKQTGLSERTRIDRIDHHEPDLKVFMDSRDTPTRPTSLQRPLAMLTGEFQYRTDGTEHLDGNPGGRQRWRTVTWAESDLVFMTVVKDGYHVTVTREVWTLSDGGRMLTRTTRSVNMDGVIEKTATFEKQ
jgi:hypothetical protein